MAPTDGPNVLLTHEWLATAGGSENVFEQLIAAFPDAVRYSLWNDDPQRFPGVLESALARSPLRNRKSLALPFLDLAARSAPIEHADLVLASSHAFGHRIAARAARQGTPAFAYVHSPARYIWTPDFDERGQSAAVRAVAPIFRRLDRAATDDRVSYVANSEFVRRRIAAAWGQDCGVIHPPVAVEEIRHSLSEPLAFEDERAAASLPDEFVLAASRLVPYKRVDRAIVLGEALGLPVVVAGIGPSMPQLETLASTSRTPVHFVGRASNRLLYELYRRALLFAFLPVEDFGIMPLEAIAAGAPAVVNAEGGAWEGVSSTGAGTRADPDDLGALTEAAGRAIGLKDKVPSTDLTSFTNQRFREKVRAWVGQG